MDGEALVHIGCEVCVCACVRVGSHTHTHPRHRSGKKERVGAICKSVKSALITASAQKATSHLAAMALIILTSCTPRHAVLARVDARARMKTRAHAGRVPARARGRWRGGPKLKQDHHLRLISRLRD